MPTPTGRASPRVLWGFLREERLLGHFRIEKIYSRGWSKRSFLRHKARSNAFKTPAPAFNRTDKLRVRLCGGRLLPHPPEQFQREIALIKISIDMQSHLIQAVNFDRFGMGLLFTLQACILARGPAGPFLPCTTSRQG